MSGPAEPRSMLELSHSGLKSIATLKPKEQWRLLASVARWAFVLALAPVVLGVVPAAISNHSVNLSIFIQACIFLGGFGAFLRLGSMFPRLSLVFTAESLTATATGPTIHATYYREEVESVRLRNVASVGATDVVVVIKGHIEDLRFALTTRSDFESLRRQLEDFNYPIMVVGDDSIIQEMR